MTRQYEYAELHMEKEELYWLYANLRDYWAVGAWQDAYLEDAHMATLWMVNMQKEYDALTEDGACLRRYEKAWEAIRERARQHEMETANG